MARPYASLLHTIMKIVKKNLGDAANASSARGTAFKELRRLLILACVLAVGVYFLVGMLVDAIVPRISFAREASFFGSIPWPYDTFSWLYFQLDWCYWC